MDLLGPNNQYLPKILTVFAEVRVMTVLIYVFHSLIFCTQIEKSMYIYMAGQVLTRKDVVTEETGGRMVNIIRQLQQTLPQSALSSIWSTLKPEQQMALQSMLSS